MGIKHLYILRHAEADSATDDHERPLSVKGQQQAFRMGIQMDKHGLAPDYAYCSTAVRTKMTLAGIQKTFLQLPSSHSFRLYNGVTNSGNVNDYVDIIQHTPSSLNNLLIVGHNPTIQSLCFTLSGNNQKFMSYAPCQLTVFEVKSDWIDLSVPDCRLLEILLPAL
ncbi:MAG: hypothetical protein GC136_01155 [Alphaproteobacteria bacterium]|nr:hypothetical protein [Alphaproteobacteria bacterium]